MKKNLDYVLLKAVKIDPKKEILNEDDRKLVFKDIVHFVNKNIKG